MRLLGISFVFSSIFCLIGCECGDVDRTSETSGSDSQTRLAPVDVSADEAEGVDEPAEPSPEALAAIKLVEELGGKIKYAEIPKSPMPSMIMFRTPSTFSMLCNVISSWVLIWRSPSGVLSPRTRWPHAISSPATKNNPNPQIANSAPCTK